MPVSKSSVYAGRRVVVTGGASFIGSHLCEDLVSLGATVTVIDNLSSGRLANLAAVASDVRFHERDLRSCPDIVRLLEGQDMIFHLAAVHGGRGFVERHGVNCLQNLRIDNALLGATAESGVPKVVYASSACVYPTHLQGPSSSDYRLQESDAGFAVAGQAFPDGLYGWAKLMGELQLKSYDDAKRVVGIACRLFSVYGPRQSASHSVAALIARTLDREDPFHIWGAGSQSRNFTYVSDTVGGLLNAGTLDRAGVLNIGAEDAVTVDELARTIFAAAGWRPDTIAHELDKPTGVVHRAADNSQTRRALGWTPQVDLADGLSKTLAWYQRYGGGATSDAALFAQG